MALLSLGVDSTVSGRGFRIGSSPVELVVLSLSVFEEGIWGVTDGAEVMGGTTCVGTGGGMMPDFLGKEDSSQATLLLTMVCRVSRS